MKRDARILLVDDDPNILTALSFLLNREGHWVQTAQSGEEAWEKLQTLTPDIAVVDVAMPDMNGYELAAKIHSEPRLEAVHILFMTDQNDNAEKTEENDADSAYRLIKPFKNQDFVAIIRELAACG